MNIIERYRGAMIGLATGDALGMPVEFEAPGTFVPLAGMEDRGAWGGALKAGQWTDDTSMALCLAESLIVRGRFDAADQMAGYVRWLRLGHLSSVGYCNGIGMTVATSLRRFLDDGQPFAGSTDPNTAGNGAIMRLAPVPLFFANYPEDAITFAAESSRTTHGAATSIDACRYLAGLIVGALHGLTKDELLSTHFCPVQGGYSVSPLVPEIAEVAGGSFKTKCPPEIAGTGYVVKSLEAALWAFFTTDTFADGCLAAANLGDDADTTAAVYGQLAGAYYGVSELPESWRNALFAFNQIQGFADLLLVMASRVERTAGGQLRVPAAALVGDGARGDETSQKNGV